MNSSESTLIINKILDKLVFKSKNLDLSLDVIKIKDNKLLTLYKLEKEFIEGLILSLESEIISSISDELKYHDGIRESDDQYEDPYEWWSRPLIRKVNELLLLLNEFLSDRYNTCQGLEAIILFGYTEKESGIYEFAIPFYWINDVRHDLELIKNFD